MEDPLLGLNGLVFQGQATQLADSMEQRIRDGFEHDCDPRLFDLYIPSLAKKPGIQTPVNVLEAIQDFIDDPQRLSLLVLGDSGLGKSTLAKYLTQLLWRDYNRDPENTALPIFINLPAIDSSKRLKHLLHTHLKKQGLERKEERLLLSGHQLLLILDGYDEIPEHENLWLKNDWSVENVKVITFCRPEVLLKHRTVGGYQALFYPPLPTHLLATKAQSLQELTLQPFTSEQIDQYLQQYVNQFSESAAQEDKSDRDKGKEEEQARKEIATCDTLSPWREWRTYRNYIDIIPGLEALVETPFILSMVVQVLPEMIAKEYPSETGQSEVAEVSAHFLLPNAKPITRTRIYDYFVEHWFSYQAQRISRQDQGLAVLTGSVARYLRIYTENLAHRLLRAGKLEVVVAEEDTLDPVLLTPRDPDYAFGYAKDKDRFLPELLAIIRSGCLLKTAGGQFSFLHKSLLEYFAANDVFSGLIAGADFILQSLKNEQIGKERDKEKVLGEEWQGTTFNEQLLVEERGILRVLADRVKQDPVFKTLLLGIVDYSKGKPEVGIAASNAITVLSQARIPMSGQDFKGIQIPGADLSGALLSGSDFSRSDLSGVRLHQAHLAYADFSHANLRDLDLGQLPALPHEDEVYSLCYSPDGRWLATGDAVGHIYIWSQETGKCQRILKNWRTFSSKDNKVSSLSFHPTQPLLAAGSEDRLIRLWQVDRGKCIGILSGHAHAVRAVAFSSDGQYLASGSLDARVRLWQVVEQRFLAEFSGDNCEVIAVGFSPDGRTMAVGGFCFGIRLWQVAEQRLLGELNEHEDSVNTVAFSSDSQILASGSDDQTVCLWQVAGCQLLAKLHGHSKGVRALAFSPDGRYLASGSEDKTVRLWQVAEQRMLAELRGHTMRVSAVTFSPDGQYLASGSDDKTVRLWQVIEQRSQREWHEPTSKLGAVAFSLDRQTLAVGDDKIVYLWQVSERQLLGKLQGHISEVRVLAFSPDGQTLASGSWGEVRLWQVAEQRLLKELRWHVNAVEALAFSPDSQILASGSNDQIVCLWRVSDQGLLRKLCRHTARIHVLAFSPDGQIVASGSDDKTVCLWQVAEGRLLGILSRHTHRINVLTFSPDGQTLASGSEDKTVCLWQVAEQRLLRELRGHTARINVLAFSPDGRILASGGGDKTVRLWQVAEQRLLGELHGHTDEVQILAFSPDGRILAYGSTDGTVRLWQLTPLHHFALLSHGSDLIKALYWQSDANQLIIVDASMHQFVWCMPSPEHQRFVLLRTTGLYPLTCTETNIAQAIGLSAGNIALLQQQGAIGVPSKRQTFYSGHSRLLELPDVQSRNAVVSVRVLSVVDSKLPVSYDNWVVSLLRHPHSKNPDHAILILEGVSAFGKAIFVKLHLVDNEDHSGRARILITTYPNIAQEDREEVMKRDVIKQQSQGTFYSKSWSLAREQAVSLFTDAKADQDKTIDYHVSGDRSLLVHSSTSSAQDRTVHNCFTWAREKLHNLNDKRIQLPSKPTDRLGAKTSFYIGPEQEDKSTCLMM